MKKSHIRILVLLVLLLIQSKNSKAVVNYHEWEGDVSSDWNNANNWEGNVFPSATQGARVGSAAFTNSPVISANSSFSPRYLFVQGGSTLTIGANLPVTRGIYAGSAAQIILNSGTLSNPGTYTLNIRNEDTKIIVNGGFLSIGDDLFLDRLLDIVPGADPTLEINGGRVLIGGDVRFDGIFAEKPTLFMSGGTLVVNGDLYNDGADVTIDFEGDSLIVNGDFIMDGTADSLFMTTGVLFLNGNNGTMTNDGIISCSGGDIVFNENYTFGGGGSTVFNNVNILSGTGSLTQSIPSFSVIGNWTKNGTFTHGSQTVVFSGSSTNTINGSGTSFYNLTLNKSSGDLDLESDISIGGNLQLTQGLILSDSTNTLTVNDNGTTSGGNSSSYVDNYMTKIGNDDFIFPLGDGGIRMQAGLFSATGTNTTDAFQIRYTRGTHPQAFFDSLSYPGDPDGMYNVSILDYWDIYRTVGAAQPFVRLYWNNADSAQIDDLNDLVVAHYLGSSIWEDLGGNGSGTVASGYVETAARVNNFSAYTFGSNSNMVNSLPITLGYFKARSTSDIVTLEWQTLSEINNDYFEVEVSTDASNFVAIGRIQGAGNSRKELTYIFVDSLPYTGGYSYYRLSQTDHDGSKSYSGIEAIYLGAAESHIQVSVFPNPVEQGLLNIHIPGLAEEMIMLFISDYHGNVVYRDERQMNANGLVQIKCPEVSGIYILNIISGSKNISRKIVVR